MNNLSKILVALARQSKPHKRVFKKKRKVAAKRKRQIKEAIFTPEQKKLLLLMTLYGNKKEAAMWWRLFLLSNFPNIDYLAAKLGMPRQVLENEYKLFLKRSKHEATFCVAASSKIQHEDSTY